MAESLRMRVFAGPNGSGKTTIIEEVRKAKVNGRPVDFGVYINADDIARALGRGYDLTPFGLDLDGGRFLTFAEGSGLLDGQLTRTALAKGMIWKPGMVRARAPLPKDRAAQLVAQFLYDELLKAKIKFSFETVFSHRGKLELMRRARDLGYKVYLYFVSTEDPAINVQRVKEIRVKQGGHDVPKDKIISRYHRTMGHLAEALELAYHAYLWDNSQHGAARLFCEMKRTRSGAEWTIQAQHVPYWFKPYLLVRQADGTDLAEIYRKSMARHLGMGTD
ncbi:MAG TPA: hypothetical protein PKD45_00260 [Flavobacteriales bacterium]|nr:hypothetical protein [Flavobacteriales bacterium]